MLIDRNELLAKIDALRAERASLSHEPQSVYFARQAGELNALTMVERMLWSWPEDDQ